MKEKRNSERQPATSDITVFIEDDIYLASMIDVSENGIRFETSEPQGVRIQIRADGEMVEYDAQLVWAKINEKGRMEYGLKRFPEKNV
jgi:hypothetical protein